MGADNSFFQKLIDAAYDKWNSIFKDFDRPDFLDELPPQERRAVILGNLNYQVENGGFGQWHCNGYSIDLPQLLKLCDKIGTPATLKIKTILVKVKTLVDEAGDGDLDSADADECDKEFYEINAEFVTEVNDWLIKTYGQPSEV